MSITKTYVGSATVGSVPGGVASFPTLSIGTAATGRKIVFVASGTVNNGTPATPSATFGGNAVRLEKVVHGHGSSGGNNHAVTAIFSIDQDTGTSGDLEVTWGMPMFDTQVFVYNLTGAASGAAEHTGGGTDAGTGQTTLSADVQVSSGAAVIAGTGSYQHSSGSSANFSYSGVTKDDFLGLYSNTNCFTSGSAIAGSAANPLSLSATIQAYGNSDQSFSIAAASFAADAGGAATVKKSIGVGLTDSPFISPRRLAA